MIPELLSKYPVGELLTRRLLLVDDELPNLAVLQAFLETDYEVLTARSGAEALELLARETVDVIIADQRMPEMTGIELLERARATRPDVATIVLTGYSDTPALISAINRARVFRYLKKPWNADEVLDAVSRASEAVAQQRAILRLVELLSARSDELAEALAELREAQKNMLHLDRLATTGRLAAGITHDLRNAMNGLLHLEREINARDADPELVESVTVGVAGVRNLMNALDTMNQFVRQRRMSMAVEYFDPAQVVKDAVTVMRLDLSFRVRRVDVEAPTGDLPPLFGDRQKLVQVLVNLLRNAVQATEPQQGIAIRVSHSGPDIVYRVEDEGPGFPEDLREHLFQAFVSSKGEQGMGLGLYMSHLIVTSHNGRIACHDRPGGGTIFEIHLPTADLPA